MSTLILIAVLLSFNPASCQSGRLNTLYEDGSFTVVPSTSTITCGDNWSEPDPGNWRVVVITLTSLTTFRAEVYHYVGSGDFPTTLLQWSFYNSVRDEMLNNYHEPQ